MSILAALVTRICLVVLFPFSALDKIFDWNGALKQANSSFLPGGPVLLILAMGCEIITPVLIIGGWYDRAAAFVLAGYCVVTALLYHAFWTYRDFWSPGESKGRSHFWDFLKNFGLVGGLLAVVLGAPLASVGYVLSHPLSTTGVYQSVAPSIASTRN
jgi:putative oxidoreductase